MAQRVEPSGYDGAVGVGVQFMEGAFVDGECRVPAAQETARGAQVLHDEMAQLPDHAEVSGGEHIGERSVAQLRRDEI